MSDTPEQKMPEEPQAPVPSPEAQPPDVQAEEPVEVAPVREWPRLSVAESDAEVEHQMRRLSRRSFLWAGAAVAASFVGWQWLIGQREWNGIPWPFRVALETNENLARDYFRSGRLAPTFPREQAQEPKPNGDVGLSDDVDASTWKLRVLGLADMSQANTQSPPSPDAADAPADKKASVKRSTTTDRKQGANSVQSDTSDANDSQSSDTGDAGNDSQDGTMAEPALELTLDAIRNLPRALHTEMVTELKCIEGWSVVVQWAGVRFADFVAHYRSTKNSENLPAYVGIETPDGEYYVGLDIESALHPQTLLCYEMNGQPLTPEHGAPLRLVIPVKYGIKNIKRIGTIRFTDERPKDYWAEQGYDWYAGH